MGYLLFTTIMIHLKLGWLGDCFFPLGHLFWPNHDYGRKTQTYQTDRIISEINMTGKRTQTYQTDRRISEINMTGKKTKTNQTDRTNLKYYSNNTQPLILHPLLLHHSQLLHHWCGAPMPCLCDHRDDLFEGVECHLQNLGNQDPGAKWEAGHRCILCVFFLHVRHGKQIFLDLFQDFPSLQKRKISSLMLRKFWISPTKGMVRVGNSLPNLVNRRISTVIKRISWFWFIDQGPGNY